MAKKKDILDPHALSEEDERKLRPQSFEDFTGQQKLIENLKVFTKSYSNLQEKGIK